jgi:hypothetical protein
MTKHTKLATRLALVAATMVGALGLTAGAVTAAPSHPAAPASVAGTYHFFYSSNSESVTLYSNNTVKFSSGCFGLWVKSGSAISMDINGGCGGGLWIFSGTVTSTGLSSQSNPGHYVYFSGSNRNLGTWYATH